MSDEHPQADSDYPPPGGVRALREHVLGEYPAVCPEYHAWLGVELIHDGSQYNCANCKHRWPNPKFAQPLKMEKLFLAQPAYLMVNLHDDLSLRVHRKYEKDRKIDIAGQVKGCILPDRESALERLVANARVCAENVCKANPSLGLSDLSLHYRITETDEHGDVWTSTTGSNVHHF